MSGWTEQWRAVVENPQFARRVAHGRQFHRSGRVSGIRATAGLLSGRVQGTRATPYLVEITVSPLDDAQWARVIDLLASQVRHSARLLAGLLPEGLDVELEAAGISLFPAIDEFDVTCACGDRAVVCPHAAGVWEAAAELLERDPFLLLRLRGRGRDRLLADLAAARQRAVHPERETGVPIAELQAQGWTRPRAPLEDLHLPVLGHPPTPAAPLKLLGDPPQWAGGVSAWDLFRPLVERAARYARDLER
ncbi:MAG: hypothetical protein ACRDZ4_22315 [Egibacteraceae bacterium]